MLNKFFDHTIQFQTFRLNSFLTVFKMPEKYVFGFSNDYLSLHRIKLYISRWGYKG